MSAMTFSDEMARIQRAVAQCCDIVLRYSQVLEALQLRRGERVLEIGCGGGYLTSEVAQCVGPTGEVRAIVLARRPSAKSNAYCVLAGGAPSWPRTGTRRCGIPRTWVARLIKAFVVGRQIVTEVDAEAWLHEFDELERQGAYFFCSMPILTEAAKVA